MAVHFYIAPFPNAQWPFTIFFTFLYDDKSNLSLLVLNVI